MSNSHNEIELSLPPNVKGTQRGYLSLNFDEIKFKSKSYSGVQITILWWGQEKEYSFRFEPARVIKYNILTNTELFTAYLQNCEPIQITLTSMKTNIIIGTSGIVIPSKLSKIISTTTQSTIQTSTPIYSVRNFNIGTLLVSFKISSVSLNINRKEAMIMKTISTNVQDIIPRVNKKLCYEKENINRDIFVEGVSCTFYSNSGKAEASKLSEKSIIEGKTKALKSQPICIDKPVSSKALDFLGGKSMSVEEELTALKEICSMSPAESLIDILIKNEQKLPQNDNHYKYIDSVKIFVKSLNLTKAGVKETCCYLNNDNSNLNDFQFVVKCRFEHYLNRESSLKFYSNRTNYLSSKIEFNSEEKSSFKLPTILDCSNLIITIWIREYDHRCSPSIFGYGKINMSQLLNNTFSCYKRCPIKLISNDSLILGSLSMNIEFGCRNLHFGQDLLDAFSKELEFSSTDSDAWDMRSWSGISKIDARDNKCIQYSKSFGSECKENDNNKESDKVAKRISSSVPSATLNSRPSTSGYNDRNNNLEENNNEQARNIVLEDNIPQKKNTLLCGLLHISDMKNFEVLNDGHYSIVNKGFSNNDDHPEPLLEDNKLLYLQLFPVLCDEKFLERVKNNYLTLELRKSKRDGTDELIGISRLPVHQFYIAFRDAAIIEHLSQSKLPVISIEGWTNVVNHSGDLRGQFEVLLAIGTEQQIEYLKISRNILKEYNAKKEFKVPSPKIIPNAELPYVSPTQPSSSQFSMLSSFIETLAQRMPGSNMPNLTNLTENRNDSNPQLRSTSDLLSNLQQALTQHPAVVTKSTQSDPSTFLPIETPIQTSIQTNSQETQTNSASVYTKSLNNNDDSMFKVLIEIEAALHLPKVLISKKFNKRNKIKNNSKNTVNEYEPSAYVTFESTDSSSPVLVKSHEGMVNSTDVVENSCNPVWNKKFEVLLSVDLMLNPEKRFILRVWRKAKNTSTAVSKPTPMEDAVIGFSSIDLSVLVSGLVCLDSWHNIIDFSGRCNGQIKVKIMPLENVLRFRENSTQSNISTPLSIDVNCDLNNTSLSRALKRKFTELDEITQRLRARLFDVTGDENIDPDDEFENDLNTEVDENELNSDGEFEWLGNMENKLFDNQANQFQNNLIGGLNTQQDISERNVSGCSSSAAGTKNYAHSYESLKNLIKGHDIDTLINPKIIKNLIDPTFQSSSSDSTPIHNSAPVILSDSNNSSVASNNTSSSSTLSQDRIRIISNALQRTSINDDESKDTKPPTDQKREVPDGGIFRNEAK